MYDLNSYFIIRQLFQRRYNSTDRALYVALDDQVQFLDFAFLDLAEQLKQEFPEIEKSVYYVGMSGVSDKLCVVGQENGKQTAAKAFFVLTDSSFFDFYDFRLTAGNGEKLKKQPDVLILTSEGADKIFGTSEAVGKSFTEVNDFKNTERSWTVAAMMENFPHRTDFQYGDGVILNSDVLRQARYRDYVFVYYRLREGTSYELLNRKIGVYMEKHPEGKYTFDCESLSLQRL